MLGLLGEAVSLVQEGQKLFGGTAQTAAPNVTVDTATPAQVQAAQQTFLTDTGTAPKKPFPWGAIVGFSAVALAIGAFVYYRN